MPTCPLPGGVSPLGDIALRAPLDARVCTENPPKVRGLRPLAADRAAGARGAAGKCINIKRAAVFSQGAKVEGALTWIIYERRQPDRRLQPRVRLIHVACSSFASSLFAASAFWTRSFGIEVVSWHCQFPRKTGVKKPGS
jgi:hypothetical protein